MHSDDKGVVGYLLLLFFLVPEKLILRVTARQCAFAGFVADAKAVKEGVDQQSRKGLEHERPTNFAVLFGAQDTEKGIDCGR